MLLEIVMLALIVIMGLLLLLSFASELVVHFLFGYSWAWERAHAGDWLFFMMLIATPLLLVGGGVLAARRRKW